MNWYRKLSVVLVAITIMTLGVGAASAQGPEQPAHALAGVGALARALTNLSDATPRDLLQAIEPGVTTLANLALEQGINPDDVVSLAAEHLTETIALAVESGRMEQAEADAILSTLTVDLNNLMNQPLTGDLLRPEDLPLDRVHDLGERGLIGALSEATGLEPLEMLQQARENGYTTLAEVAEANEISTDTLIATAIADATERINEAVENGTLSRLQADALLNNLDEIFNRIMTHNISNLLNAAERPAFDAAREILQEVSVSTGLEPREILRRVQQGESMAEILSASGVDVDSVVESLLARANARLETQIRNVLNGTRPEPPQN